MQPFVMDEEATAPIQGPQLALLGREDQRWRRASASEAEDVAAKDGPQQTGLAARC